MKRSLLLLLPLSMFLLSFMELFLFPSDVTGWIVKDGFGSFYFYNGCYVSPISKRITDDLEKYAGKPVNLHVYKGVQYINPGNARFDSVAVTGAAQPDSMFSRRLSLTMRVASLKESETLAFLFELRNTGKNGKRIYPGQLTFIITRLRTAQEERDQALHPEDGESLIVYERRYSDCYLATDMNDPKTWETYKHVTLAAGDVHKQEIHHRLPDGTYYAWPGYGDNNFDEAPCLMGPGTTFRIAAGKLEIITGIDNAPGD